VKKLVLLVLVLALFLSSCGTEGSKYISQGKQNPTVFENLSQPGLVDIYRFVDSQYGNVCYLYKTSIFCVKY